VFEQECDWLFAWASGLANRGCNPPRRHGQGVVGKRRAPIAQGDPRSVAIHLGREARRQGAFNFVAVERLAHGSAEWEI
jgi:hypothetical protein